MLKIRCLVRRRALACVVNRPITSSFLRPSSTRSRRVDEAFAGKPLDIDNLLSEPTWSVRSLLPTTANSSPPVTPEQLHHLLRLSALPQPESPEEEAQMLETLQSQLHFVKEIQSVDTTGVEPLQAIRDETEEGIKERTIGMEALKEAFANEEITGKNRRPRRKRDVPVDTMGAEDWNVLGHAERTAGKYFVVNSSKTE